MCKLWENNKAICDWCKRREARVSIIHNICPLKPVGIYECAPYATRRVACRSCSIRLLRMDFRKPSKERGIAMDVDWEELAR